MKNCLSFSIQLDLLVNSGLLHWDGWSEREAKGPVIIYWGGGPLYLGEGHYFLSSTLGRAIFKKISLRGGLRFLRL